MLKRTLSILAVLSLYFIAIGGNIFAHAWPKDRYGLNTPAPELEAKIKEAHSRLTSDPSLLRRLRSDRALQALHTQVLNQIQHVSFDFAMRDASYTHDFVLQARYPKRPTEIALEKVNDFFRIASQHESPKFQSFPEDQAREQELILQQKDLVNRIADQSIKTYEEFRNRLIDKGPEAPFPEFAPIVEILLRKLSVGKIEEACLENQVLKNFRSLVASDLSLLLQGKSFPYMKTIESIQRTLEFFDIYQRATDPDRSPKLYHSARYDYYGHYLKAEVPDHIIMPTLYSLGASDILKSRGVPISFVGVNTDITWVDGFYQTSYEFWVHDINHSRRMFQFFKEMAETKGLSISEFAKESDRFVKTQVMPLMKIKKNDSNETKNMKRLIKVIFFEIFHEDALAATIEVAKAGILRPPNLITPFEHIENGTVTYVMEPGATTLAYVFRKLAHDFYDMPGDRLENIVDPKYRTREKIVEAAGIISSRLGFKVPEELLNYLVSTDLGFPKDFKQTVANDIKARPGETEPLDKDVPISSQDVAFILANSFHDNWQQRSGYRERWKIAQAAFKDGRGVSDGFVIQNSQDLSEYFEERNIPLELRKYYSIQPHPQTGKLVLYEDIQHLPNKYLAPNNQYENVQGAMAALNSVERLVERKVFFATVDEAIQWLTAACHTMHREWLKRNKHWVSAYPEYNRDWKDLPAVKQKNGLEILKMALELKSNVDGNWIAPSQKTLILEAIRRMNVDNSRRSAVEVRAYVTGEKIHDNWRKISGYQERWKPTNAKLDNGQEVQTQQDLQIYLNERKVPHYLRRFFRIQLDPRYNKHILFEDLQHLPNKYLAQNHQEENYLSGLAAASVVDRVWDRELQFSTVEKAARWLRGAAQMVHQAVLDRNANGARDNPVYNRPWKDLPPINQLNDLALVRMALEARFSLAPGAMTEDQRQTLLQALQALETSLYNRKCEAEFESQKESKP